MPTTNPTSTAIYKILISMKARCPIVISPHPSAVRCITRVAEIMNDAARQAGAPDGSDQLDDDRHARGHAGVDEGARSRRHPATGGMGLVRAAYSAGKPPTASGPGNAPAYIERSADIPKAVLDIITGKTFDNGLLCSSENSVVVDAPLVDEVKREFVGQRRLFPLTLRDRRLAQGAGHAAAAAESCACRQARHLHRAARRASAVPAARAC